RSCDSNLAAVLVLIFVLLLRTVVATLLRRTHLTLTRLLTGLVTLPAFLTLLARSLAATLLIRTGLVLTLTWLLVPLGSLLLLVTIGIATRLRIAILILRIVTLIRHESLLEWRC
ncbi:MAG TPA: hypothetical protein VIU34_21795, partial [Steroidobacter sp.]